MQPIQPAARTRAIKYAVRDILAVADEAKAAGKDLVYLNIGDPNIFDFETPAPIVEAIERALRDGHCGYAPSPGIPAALEAIRGAATAKGIRGVRDVFVGTGCSEVIDLALSALCNAGDNILTPSPGYPLYTAIQSRLELTPNPYFLSEEDDWQPDLDDIAAKIDDKTRAIVVINPNNPTGSVYRRDTLEGLLELARKHELVVFADEIYDKLCLDGVEHVSLASLADDVPILTFNGLSKAYLGPGLRIGWAIVSGPEPVVAPYIEAIHKFLRARLSASHPVMHAIPAALADDSHLPGVLEKLTRRRDITVEMLSAIDGISIVPPKAAFYAFPRLHIDGSDVDVVSDMIRATGVVVVHGTGFGQRPGTAHFRVVYLPQEDRLRQAYDAIGAFMQSLPVKTA